MTSQSGRRVAILTAIQTHYLTGNTTVDSLPSPDHAIVVYAPIIAGMLVVLMCGILAGVCILMREKRKRIQEATSLHNLPWIDSLEVFTVSGREGAAGMFLPPGIPGLPSPPPTYEAVVKNNEKEREAATQLNTTSVSPPAEEQLPTTAESRRPTVPVTSDDLPSYEVAVKMEGNM